MYCPYCGSALTASPGFCCACGKNIRFLKDVANKVPEEMPRTSAHANAHPSDAGSSGVESFMKFRAIKERERKRFFSKTRPKEQKHKQELAKIYVGVMKMKGDSLKPVRGKSLLLEIQPQWSSDQLWAAAVKKLKDFNQDMEDGAHVLLYPDAQEVRNIPGTDTPFTVQKYKEAIGKAYQRITMYICTVEDFENSCYSGQPSSEDDSEVHVNLPSGGSPLSDTVFWDGLDEVSTPRMDNILHGHPKPAADQERRKTAVQEEVKSAQGQTNFYRNYTNVYAPIVIDSESEPEEHMEHTAEERTEDLTAADIVSQLSAKIIKTSCSRFNINRANVWDGAVRGFKRASFDPSYELLVKFTDDEGQTEDAMDTGGPKREFLTLLMNCLRTRRIFDGPEDSKYLIFDSAAARDDEYFLAGRMIATSIVHGGPGPRFLSEIFYQHLTGGTITDIEAKIEDVRDDTMRAALLEISNAATLDELHASVDRHSSLLQTAGCFQYPDGVDEKDKIIKDFMQWYIIYRNHFSIQRFKDGLSTLDVNHALEQHASVFRAFMCSSVEQLTSTTLEELFEVQFSEKGNTRRQEETRVVGFWRDYLLETEDKRTGLFLHDILMFATGLNTLPPSGIQPRPKLIFQSTSRFPVSRTCANTIEIPMSKTYDQFQNDMDFGIQNSPGFGLQ